MTIKIDNTKSWPITFNKPLIIAGPCSAESEDQMLRTAHELKHHENLLFRAEQKHFTTTSSLLQQIKQE